MDMQELLDRYQGRHSNGDSSSFPENEDEAFERLVHSYKNDYGTEGHDLGPYRELLQFCRQTTSSNEQMIEHGEVPFCEVLIHGGFIPRNHAARLNKECPDAESKRLFYEEMSSHRGYIPKSQDAMHRALFADSAQNSNGSNDSFNLRGTPEHRLLIESLMNGADLYSPAECDEVSNEEEGDDVEEESPMKRLYQAQLLKDHAMGYRIASLMLEHHQKSATSNKTNQNSPTDDRYIVIAGFGHLKHYLGVPDCVKGYLQQEALSHPDYDRRSAAMDLLLSVSKPPVSTKSKNSKIGSGSALIGCQMMYEAYLEDSYPPTMELVAADDGNDDKIDEKKGKVLKDLYLQNPSLLDKHILLSNEISGAFLRFADGVAGFEHPCADYLFVYDEDDDNTINEEDLARYKKSLLDPSGDQARCPFHHQQNDLAMADLDAKAETLDAYERVGKSAGIKGNVSRARAIMTQIGYKESDLEYLGEDDIYNFQGVANPHNVAKIQSGETVLDIGSGLGIDSFLAMRDSGADSCQQMEENQEYGAVGTGPFVVGVDLAESEVKHTIKRAKERGYDVPHRLCFIRGDVEKLDEAFTRLGVPFENKFNVCISNGAFCLVPNKRDAFQNVFKALSSGGRMAISTTTIVSDRLDPSYEWPVCMRMFATLESLKPMCEEIGFRNVKIIDADSPMEGMEIPEDIVEHMDDDKGKRFKIHGKYADQFSFLENMDMDDLCKVVTIYGEKQLDLR